MPVSVCPVKMEAARCPVLKGIEGKLSSPLLCRRYVGACNRGEHGIWATRLAEARVPAARPLCVCLTPSPWTVEKTDDMARAFALNTHKTHNQPEPYLVLHPFGFYQTKQDAVSETSLSALFWDQGCHRILEPVLQSRPSPPLAGSAVAPRLLAP